MCVPASKAGCWFRCVGQPGQPSSAYRWRHLFTVPTSTRSRTVLALVGVVVLAAAGYVGLVRRLVSREAGY
jgi:hypothetical protein